MKHRKIKFKVWSKEQNKFISGYPIGYKKPDGVELCGISQGDGEDETIEDGAVLLQYTGLKDKNGREIYEGDILEYETMKGDKFIGPVRWGRYQFYKGEMVTWVASPIALIPETFKESVLHDCEVVGNIYENPELLKTK